MTQAKSVKKTSRNQYTPEFRQQALALAERIGVAKAARELGLHDSQLYVWRSKQRQQGSTSEREQQQATEIARLKRQLAERDEELAILQKAAVDSIGQRNSHVKTWGCGGFLNETDIYSKGKSICF